ncbi:hypothetical protein FML04_27925 [Klebsiella oxytoca]|nr:hypothetical protein [Klebsiella oxytoca]PLL98378.1 hypothetical protein CWN68_10825 [Klebsiella michiganensis]HBY5092812.1 hypothetical protein [Klebsiella pneumoniae]MBZ7645276.1 hypothetical protein [Klebsiella oxytoca]MBZ7666712.1 hypothetical protein [Klebsiella oxytoca]
MPVITRLSSAHATALKPTHKAGRRGGESTARQRTFAHLFSQPERVAAPRRFAGCRRVMRGCARAWRASEAVRRGGKEKPPGGGENQSLSVSRV